MDASCTNLGEFILRLAQLLWPGLDKIRMVPALVYLSRLELRNLGDQIGLGWSYEIVGTR
jgi:hypothetical protein